MYARDPVVKHQRSWAASGGHTKQQGQIKTCTEGSHLLPSGGFFGGKFVCEKLKSATRI